MAGRRLGAPATIPSPGDGRPATLRVFSALAFSPSGADQHAVVCALQQQQQRRRRRRRWRQQLHHRDQSTAARVRREQQQQCRGSLRWRLLEPSPAGSSMATPTMLRCAPLDWRCGSLTRAAARAEWQERPPPERRARQRRTAVYPREARGLQSVRLYA